MVAAKRLDQSEEASLARLARGGDAKAKRVLVKRNLPLVFHIAKRFKGPLPLEDRIQEGVTGLIRAAERFLPEKGVRFGTYASWWIRQAISRAIANQSREIRLPVQMHVRLRRIEKEAEHLGRKLGRSPTMEELSKEVGLPTKKLSSYARMSRSPISLSALRSDGEAGLREPSSAADDVAAWTPEKVVMTDILRGDVAKSLRELKPRERYVVGRRFGLFGTKASTLNGIAKELGLSRERVRQIVKNALRKIRESDFAEGLKDFY
jgi:RNA polymerase sigma factor (sigma-70 family)